MCGNIIRFNHVRSKRNFASLRAEGSLQILLVVVVYLFGAMAITACETRLSKSQGQYVRNTPIIRFCWKRPPLFIFWHPALLPCIWKSLNHQRTVHLDHISLEHHCLSSAVRMLYRRCCVGDACAHTFE